MAIYIREYEEGKEKEQAKKEIWKERLGKITIWQDSHNQIVEVPSIKSKGEEKKQRKRAKKIQKKIFSKEGKEIVLSNKLLADSILCTSLESKKELITGRKVYPYLAIFMLEELMEKRKQKMEEQKIYILVNDNTQIHIELIQELAQKAKGIHIISNHIEKFKRLENIFLEEMGILITVSNNKRKSLAKAEWILNLDFPSELVNRFQIYPKAILINIQEEVIIKKKSFEGINIQGCQISYPLTEEEKKIYQGFDLLSHYEASKLLKGNMKVVNKKLQEDGVQIQSFIGTNGVIAEEELRDTKKSH